MISIIIPAYNEEAHIGRTITHLLKNPVNAKQIAEIIVVDGGSTDATVSETAATGAKVIISPRKGRAAQMNLGASIAKLIFYIFYTLIQYRRKPLPVIF